MAVGRTNCTGTARPLPKLCRILANMDELMFSSGNLRDSLDAHLQRMVSAVNREPEDSLRQADVGEWSASLAHHYTVTCPELLEDEIWIAPPSDITLPHPWASQFEIPSYSSLAAGIPGYRLEVHLPLRGDVTVLQVRPSSFTFNPPRGTVRTSELLMVLEYAHSDPPDIDERVRIWVGSVETWLSFARADIAIFNAGLEQQAQQAVQRRLQKLSERDAHLASSKFPLRRPGSNPTKMSIEDALVRRPAPRLPQTRSDGIAPTLGPALQNDVFEHILGVIRMQGRQMEQSPGAYAGLDEEARRQTLVATLNTHYEGRTTAEAFNYHGKTDILIRYGTYNLFVCECKFWTGSADFTATIDQLFRYTTWRDTKLALVVFVREKGLTQILQKATLALTAHPQFVRMTQKATESELRADMHWPGDEDRMADLNILFVHIL